MQSSHIYGGAKKPFVIVAGNCGTGKTTTASFLHKRLDDCKLFSFDNVRIMMGLHEYRKEDAPRIMRQTDILVHSALFDGFGIIVERPPQTYPSRAISYDAARAFGRQALLIECICPEAVAKSRILGRTKNSFNDNPESFDRVKRNWENISFDFQIDPSLAEFVSYIRYDTGAIRASVERVSDALRVFVENVALLLDSFRLE